MLLPFVLASTLTVTAAGIGPVVVVDGDTVRIGREVVRGLDAPEVRGHCRAEVEGAAAARRRLADLVDHAGLIEVIRSDRKDNYRQTLARLMVDGRDVAGIMVAEGLARPYEGGKREPWC